MNNHFPAGSSPSTWLSRNSAPNEQGYFSYIFVSQPMLFILTAITFGLYEDYWIASNLHALHLSDPNRYADVSIFSVSLLRYRKRFVNFTNEVLAQKCVRRVGAWVAYVDPIVVLSLIIFYLALAFFLGDDPAPVELITTLTAIAWALARALLSLPLQFAVRKIGFEEIDLQSI